LKFKQKVVKDFGPIDLKSYLRKKRVIEEEKMLSCFEKMKNI
ncbi:MAG: hypothetical protein ACI8VJ_001331, partial [Polaribacter sp.]